MPNIKGVSFSEFKQLFQIAVDEHLLQGEPIPEMNKYSIGEIKSALEYPFQTAGGHDIFKGVEQKAASLLYSFAKGHFLTNGNKRLALLVFELFLDKNGYEYGDSEGLKILISEVVSSDPKDKDNQIIKIANRLKNHPTMTNTEINEKIAKAEKNSALPEKYKAKYIADLKAQLKPEQSEVGGHEPKTEPAPAPKAEKKATKKEPKVKVKSAAKAEKKGPDYDCDDLIIKEKEKVKKRRDAAQKRKEEPAKTPATKNKEAIEKVTEKIETNIEKRIEKGQVGKAELDKLIAETELLLKMLRLQRSKIK